MTKQILLLNGLQSQLLGSLELERRPIFLSEWLAQVLAPGESQPRPRVCAGRPTSPPICPFSRLTQAGSIRP
jgi:hypothetical protein